MGTNLKSIVAFSVGKNYWPHVATAVKSLYDACYDVVPEVIIFYERLDQHWKKKIQIFAQDTGGIISFAKFSVPEVKYFVPWHDGHSTYYRIYFPELLTLYDRVLYLDSDIIILADLNELLSINLEDYPFAASSILSKAAREQLNSAINRERDAVYFNAGVMLIDINNWRRLDITRRVANTILNNKKCFECGDQDALNIVINGNFKHLDLKWNLTSRYFELSGPGDILDQHDEELLNALRDAKIIHFTGTEKPWHLNCQHSRRSNYTRIRDSMHWYPYHLIMSALTYSYTALIAFHKRSIFVKNAFLRYVKKRLSAV